MLVYVSVSELDTEMQAPRDARALKLGFGCPETMGLLHCAISMLHSAQRMRWYIDESIVISGGTEFGLGRRSAFVMTK